MTNDLTKHIDALRGRVPDMALRIYDFLRCPAWTGWRPMSVGAVEKAIHEGLYRFEERYNKAGVTETNCGGITVRLSRDEYGPTVTVAFECQWEAMIDGDNPNQVFVVPGSE